MNEQQKTCKNCLRAFRRESDFLENTYQWRLCSNENLWFNCRCGSTLMLPRGKFPWYTPDIGMSEETGYLFNRLSTERKIPYIPTALMDLHRLATSSDFEPYKIESALRKEPLIAAEILGLADTLRSVRNPEEKPFSNLVHAMVYAGQEQLIQLITVATVRTFQLETTRFPQDHFWNHAFLTGKINEFLMQKINLSEDEKDKAFVAGCLCNIGKIVGAVLFPVETDKIWEQTTDLATQTFWQEAEGQLEIPNHETLGEIGAAFWGFPHFISDVARFHHSSPAEYSRLKNKTLISLTGLSNYLAYWLLLEPHRINEPSMSALASFFGYSDSDLELLTQEITSSINS